MQRALERHNAGEAHIISIVLRPVDLEGTPIVKLQMLPKGAKPITTLSNRDEAFQDVAREIRKVVRTLLFQAQRTKEQWKREGETHNRARDYYKALNAYKRALLLDPNDVDLRMKTGNVLQSLERYAEALAAYEEVILLDPNYANAYLNKGSVLFDLNRYAEALVAYEQAILLDPNHIVSYLGKMLALEYLGRLEEAQQIREVVIALNERLKSH